MFFSQRFLAFSTSKGSIPFLSNIQSTLRATQLWKIMSQPHITALMLRSERRVSSLELLVGRLAQVPVELVGVSTVGHQKSSASETRRSCSFVVRVYPAVV